MQERSMLARYRMFAGYNAWCNERLFDASARVSDADYRANRGVFFKSLHGTLNHLLVGDRIWMRRFTGEGEIPPSLDAILYDNFDRLRAARRNEDERIRRYISALSEADLAKTIRYRTVVNPQDIEQPLAPALDHFFNHQTHHRGQAHALLSAISGNELTPSFDLIIYQRQTGDGGLKIT
ncbi:MAG TPA: DinB family protein, partial [Pseudolabrys sp.]